MGSHRRDLKKFTKEVVAEQEAIFGEKSRKPPLRKRVVARIPQKHRTTRLAAHILFGTVAGLGRTGRLAGRGARTAGKVAGRKFARDMTRTLWGDVDKPPARGAWFKRGDNFTCVCGFSTRDVQEHTRHMLEQHRSESRAPRPLPSLTLGTTRRTAGKTIVRPVGWVPTGRHRKPVNRTVAVKQAVESLAERYRARITKLGERQMSVDGSSARIIGNAFRSYSDLPTPKKLSGLRDEFAGTERGFALAMDAVYERGRVLKRPAENGGAGIAPELVDAWVRETQDALSDAAVAASKFIAGFDVVYDLQIKAARGQLGTPGIDLAG